MVSARLKEGESARGSMEMGSSDRPKQLHNFALPCLRWSNQRHLRCVKVNNPSQRVLEDVGGGRSLKVSVRRIESDAEDAMAAQVLDKPAMLILGSRSRGGSGDSDDGTGGRKEKRRTGDELWGEREEDSGVPAEEKEASEREPGAVAVAQVAVPWNLRTRRLSYKALAGLNGGAKVGDSPSRSENVDVGGSGNGGNNEERAKFAVPLTRKEIEVDFKEMTGHRPPRRPKKRNRAVQKNLDTLFPGLWLTEVTADAYKVEEVAEIRKR